MMGEGSKPEDLFPWEEAPAESAETGPTHAGDSVVESGEPDDRDGMRAAAVDTPALKRR
jgi:hypothetical protein